MRRCRDFLLIMVLCSVATAADEPVRKPSDEPLLGWAVCRVHRTSVVHPAATIKPDDLARAKGNLERHAWAQEYLRGLERSVRDWPQKINPEYLRQMVPATTPGDTLFTPCPACRDQGKPWHPHGQWDWSAEASDRLTCKICGTVFPNEKYPEAIELRAAYGGGQVFTYCGAEPFQIFSYLGRPSFSGNIRARKVHFISGICRQLAEAYALSGKTEYARATRAILLRLAEAYPQWLVHVGYGEYADMDPHVAALNINHLPKDELCPPPARPDRRLHTGYWSAGRASGVGMEAGFVRKMVEAYEFTCEAVADGRPVYSDDERIRIEQDLLLESSVLLFADKQVNNKSVGNATAVALVGMSVGHPEMVRFGLDVFLKTVDGWFLPDGGTSESWAYAMMTLGGVSPLGQALRGYSDPPGYRDAEGKRIDRMDLYHDTAYSKVWAAMFNGMQGDLSYPPLADGSPGSQLGAHYAELMADNYPENPQYQALLKATAGDDLARGDRSLAIYYRPVDLADQQAPPVTLPDYCFPELKLGYLRSGPTGRDSSLVLSATDWGGHHHLDSLNLYYWHQGQELLSDLGYLWDHPQKPMTMRTPAHNTVIVDGKDQVSKGRGGAFTLFATTQRVKVMEAESRAYAQADLYRRTVAQIECSDGRHYIVDLFRVRGGQRHEYVFHGPNRDVATKGPSVGPIDAGEVSSALDLANVRGSGKPGPWTLTWNLADHRRFQALWENEAGQLTMIGDGWGQRDWHNTDLGATLPYVVRRAGAGKGLTAFVTAFQSVGAADPIVEEIRRLPVPEDQAEGTVLIAVRTASSTEYVVSCIEPRRVKLTTPDGSLESDGRFAVVSIQSGKPAFAQVFDGEVLRWNDQDCR
ncbi:MAG: heparinase II/III family protein [Pirellulales bacterium]|nr:heparinase II/III family protein [Pirellulales bacterium]